jgi:hypothetical protein
MAGHRFLTQGAGTVRVRLSGVLLLIPCLLGACAPRAAGQSYPVYNPANVTTFTDTGLHPQTTYTSQVRAWNPTGGASSPDEASATTPVALKRQGS